MLRFLTKLCFAFLLTAPAAAQDDLSNHYDLTARFDPASGAIDVEGSMTIVADGPIERIELLLNKSLVLRRFEYGDGLRPEVQRDVMISGQALPRTQRLVLPLDAPLSRGDRLELRFAYSGRITTQDIEIGRGVVSPAWTEMTLEALWYPVFLEEPLVRSRLTLETPEGYEVVGPGEVRRLEDGRWLLDPSVPVAGRITFAMSNAWISAREPLNEEISAVLYSVEPEPRASEILGAVGDAFSAYEELFGPPRTNKREIRLLYPNRDPGLVWPNQAYSTGGDLIVMNIADLQTQLDVLNHEVAHLWWSVGRAGTPDEFLSESISEYLATRHGGQVWGADWLEHRRQAMRRESEAIEGSLLEIDGVGGARQPLLYQRGPTALWALHDRLGQEAMDALLVSAYQQRIDTLAAFVESIQARDGEAAEAFRDSL
ncbi:hypothetical protein [Brevundimonas sp.]|uniref:hypothetical protein n=1 Tax=Brevundimonas sp. TaxID=1871086 RepID=UPI0039E54C85